MRVRNLVKISLVVMVAGVITACGLNPIWTETPIKRPPTEVVQDFYNWYRSNLGYNSTTDILRQASEEQLEARPDLSNELLSRRLEPLSSFVGVGRYDPMLCAQ